MMILVVIFGVVFYFVVIIVGFLGDGSFCCNVIVDVGSGSLNVVDENILD